MEENAEKAGFKKEQIRGCNTITHVTTTRKPTTKKPKTTVAATTTTTAAAAGNSTEAELEENDTSRRRRRREDDENDTEVETEEAKEAEDDSAGSSAGKAKPSPKKPKSKPKPTLTPEQKEKQKQRLAEEEEKRKEFNKMMAEKRTECMKKNKEYLTWRFDFLKNSMKFNKGDNVECTEQVYGKKKVWKDENGLQHDVKIKNGTYHYWEKHYHKYEDTRIAEGTEAANNITEKEGLYGKPYTCYCQTTE